VAIATQTMTDEQRKSVALEYLKASDNAGITSTGGTRDGGVPQMTFVSTDIRQVDETTFEVTGDLTIKGVTSQITVPFEFEGASQDPFGNQRIGFDGSVTINRKDYGVTWNAALETGGVLVGEKIVLEFEVSAIKNA
jgi:hypothetical protein